MFDLDDCIASITCKGAKMLAERLEHRLNVYDVTRVQWIAMYYVSQYEPITQKQLAEKMYLKESTIVRLLDRMEKEKVLVRECSPADRRVRYLKLTEKGQKIKEELSVIVENFKNDAIEGISEEDLDTYKKVLDQMLENTMDM